MPYIQIMQMNKALTCFNYNYYLHTVNYYDNLGKKCHGIYEFISDESLTSTFKMF